MYRLYQGITLLICRRNLKQHNSHDIYLQTGIISKFSEKDLRS